MKKTIVYIYLVLSFFTFNKLLIAQDTIDSSIDSNLIKLAHDTVFLSYEDSLCIDSVLNEVIYYAKTYLGTPYKFRGAAGEGFDCSGFINHIFLPYGYLMPSSSSGYTIIGIHMDINNLQKGDFMLFKGRNVNSTRIGHVAMVIEADIPNNVLKIIHSTRRGVVIDNYFTSAYYNQRFIMGIRPKY